MKTYYSILLGLFFYQPAIAQNSRISNYSPDDLMFKEYNLKTGRHAPEQIKLPFASIAVMDSRYDTGKIGFVYSNTILDDGLTMYKKLRVKNGLKKSIENYYNRYYIHSFEKTNYTLLIDIKKFWLSSIGPEKKESQNIAENINASAFLHLKIEFYLHKEGRYLPFKRIDTILKTPHDILKNSDEEVQEYRSASLTDILNSFVEQYNFNKAIEVFDSRKKISMPEILVLNNHRFSLNILKDSKRPDGIYMSFTEFVNNKPSIIHFKEMKMNYSNFKKEEYLTNENDSLINNYWAYSKNNILKIGPFGNDKLIRAGNTFEFFKKVTIRDFNSVKLGAGTFNYKNKKETWVPYQVDMETGLIY